MGCNENNKTFPIKQDKLKEIIQKYPTPFHIYDEKAILENAKEFIDSFSWLSKYGAKFKEFFAVKALPNPAIIKTLSSLGIGCDASSIAELYLSERAGVVGENIIFTSNDTPISEFQKAKEIGAIINLDDITHIDFLEKAIGSLPELLCFRYNPGPLKDGNDIIGKPEEAKYGLTAPQMKEAYKIAKSKGVKRFGMHVMVASNELNVDYFVETADILFKLAVEVEEECGIKLEFINLGGGVGIAYKPEQKPIKWSELSSKIEKLYLTYFKKDSKPNIFFELGRAITGPYGYLVTTAIHKKDTYKNYIGLDACMANLMRPALYGAYHHITVLGKEAAARDHKYDIVGSLCENNDKFAIDRMLPKIDMGDIVILHDTGAHGHAMGFNYNGKLRSAEVLLKADGSFELIRRAETLDDLFATLNL